VYLDAMWRRIRKKTGFYDLRIHDLRRTIGSWLVRDDASLHLVGAVLNHKDQKTTAGYAYFQTEDRQRALDRHGESVVQVTRYRTRQPTNGASPASTTQQTETTAFPRVHRISRKDLYELIWSEPTTTLARDLAYRMLASQKSVADRTFPRRLGATGQRLLRAIPSSAWNFRSEQILAPNGSCSESEPTHARPSRVRFAHQVRDVCSSTLVYWGVATVSGSK
jgi:hypothetical protein